MLILLAISLATAWICRVRRLPRDLARALPAARWLVVSLVVRALRTRRQTADLIGPAIYLSTAQSAAAVATSMQVTRPTPVSSLRWS